MSSLRGARFLTSLGRQSLKINRLNQRKIASLGLTSLTQLSLRKRALLDANTIPVNKFDLSTVGVLSPVSSVLFSTEALSISDNDTVEVTEDETDAGRIKTLGKWPAPSDKRLPMKKKYSRYSNHKVHISGTGFNQDYDYLNELFSQFGEIQDIFFPKQRYGNTADDYSFGFISFSQKSGVEKALEAISVVDNDGVTISISPPAKKENRTQNQRQQQEKNMQKDIFVHNLSKDITIDELNDHFKQFGVVELLNLHIPFHSGIKNQSTPSYAIIRYKEGSLLHDVCSIEHNLNNSNLLVDYSRKRIKDVDRCNKLYLSDITETLTEEEVTSYLSQYGEITDIYLNDDARCGTVCFSSKESAASAGESRWHSIGTSDVKARIIGIRNE